jgi:hypothetical protein
MFDGIANHLFQLGFGFCNLMINSFLVEIGEVGMRHRMAANVETQ